MFLQQLLNVELSIVRLSTDKGGYPVNAMGTSKAMMKKLLL